MPREVCTPSKPLFTQMAAIFGTFIFMYFFYVKFQRSLIFEFFGTLFTFELIYTIVHIVYMFVNVTLKFGGKITASLTVIFIFERAIISSIFTVSISCKRKRIRNYGTQSQCGYFMIFCQSDFTWNQLWGFAIFCNFGCSEFWLFCQFQPTKSAKNHWNKNSEPLNVLKQQISHFYNPQNWFP